MVNAFYLTLFAACACFMASRVYLLVFKGELNVKGFVYTRAGTPFRYWSTLAFALISTAFCLLMMVAAIFWIVNGM
jgi:hypothetical protein